MINRAYFYADQCRDPHRTLALEEHMLNNIGAGEIILYLYTHKDAVVIGRNQNAWAECRHEQLFMDGGKLARRISGGGAVFHDEQNLNFSFIVGKENYDLHRQLKVILEAVRTFGIEAEFSGRNDILAGGRKFSGNAFCFKKDGAFHHGTIMIDTDTGKLARYLAVSRDKIESKGISSVRSRVINLRELNPDVSNEKMAEALKCSFENEYGKISDYVITERVEQSVAELAQRNASWEWQFGESPRSDISTSARFPWGGIELAFTLKGGKVAGARIYSDAMDADIIQQAAQCFIGHAFKSGELAQAISQLSHSAGEAQIIKDIKNYLLEQRY